MKKIIIFTMFIILICSLVSAVTPTNNGATDGESGIYYPPSLFDSIIEGFPSFFSPAVIVESSGVNLGVCEDYEGRFIFNNKYEPSQVVVFGGSCSDNAKIRLYSCDNEPCSVMTFETEIYKVDGVRPRITDLDSETIYSYKCYGCEGEGTGDTTPETEPVVGTRLCFPEGDKLCLSAIIQGDSFLCDIDHVRECQDGCDTSTNQCKTDGGGTAEPDCSENQMICQTNKVLKCMGGTWNTLEDCDEGSRICEERSYSNSWCAPSEWYYCLNDEKNTCTKSSNHLDNCYDSSSECESKKVIPVIGACCERANWDPRGLYKSKYFVPEDNICKTPSIPTSYENCEIPEAINFGELGKTTLTRDQIKRVTSQQLLGSACLGDKECSGELEGYEAQCWSLASLRMEGTLPAGRIDSFMDDAKAVVSGATTGALVGLVACPILATGALGLSAAASGGATIFLSPAFFGASATCVGLFAGGGAALGEGTNLIFDEEDPLVKALEAKDDTKIGVCTFQKQSGGFSFGDSCPDVIRTLPLTFGQDEDCTMGWIYAVMAGLIGLIAVFMLTKQ